MAGALEHHLGGGGVVEVAEVGLPHQLPVTTQELWQPFGYKYLSVAFRFLNFYDLSLCAIALKTGNGQFFPPDDGFANNTIGAEWLEGYLPNVQIYNFET